MSQCLVVPREKLESLPSWQSLQKREGDNLLHSIIPLDQREIEIFLETAKQYGEFRERFGENGIESDSNFQQIIFYGLLLKGNSFFMYRRGNAGMSEKRLASKFSIGIGGHIEPFDSNLIDSLYREIDEELQFFKKGIPLALRTKSGVLNLELFQRIVSVQVVGLIKNESDDVGKVHTGLLCFVRLLLPDLDVVIKDKNENASGRFMTKNEYMDIVRGNGEEVWTKLVIESDLFPL
jgi:predicted NUDIX family phosphoesterase